MASEPRARTRRHALSVMAGSGLLVCGSAWLGIEFTAGPERIAAIWVANALLLTVLVRCPSAWWPGLFLSGYFGNAAANLLAGDTPTLAVTLAACNTFETLLVSVPLRAGFGRALDLSRLGQLAVFVGLGAVVAPALSGAAAAQLLRIEGGTPFAATFAAWYPADALGYLVVTPLLLMVRLDELRSLISPQRRLQTVGWLSAVLVVTAIVFCQNTYPLLFLPMAILGLVVVQIGPSGTALAIGIVASAAVLATAAGRGPMMLVPGDLTTRVMVLQVFIAATVMAKLPLIAILGDRARFAQQAREANRSLLLAEKVARIGHWSVDVASNVLTWSDGVYRIHGLDPAAHTPTVETGIAFYHPDDRTELAHAVARSLFQGQDFNVASRLIRSDGAVRNVVARGLCEIGVDGVVTALFGTIIDVTDVREAERAVAASEARYRLLAENASDLIIHCSANGRRFHYISPAVGAMLGYTAEALRALALEDWVHPDDLGALRQVVQGLAADGSTATSTHRIRHQNGHYIWAEGAYRRVGEKARGGIVAAIRDVTERVRQAEQLEKAKIAAEAGARTQAEFLANMSHELRTPLTGMLGVHALLQSDPTLGAAQRRYVDLAHESGQTLLTIVNDILDLSKIEAGHMAVERVPFSMRALVESCRQLGAQSLRGKPVVFDAAVGADVPDLLLGDPTRLRQILHNLVGNAVKFTGEGRIGLAVSFEAGMLRIDVSDTGIGIAPEALPRLFERFSQADGSITRRFGGTGLGLSISKRLVDLMGGTIDVDSTIGSGSRFSIAIPAAIAEDRRSGSAAYSMADAGASRRVLLAEDNAINQEIIRTILEGKGFAVTVVGNGVEAVLAFEAVVAFEAQRFDIVLMDVQMPDMDGLSATAAIRTLERAGHRPATPIVALTANAMVAETDRCRAAGMDAHIAKPIEWAKLFATIERLCRTRDADAAEERRGAGAPMLDRSVASPTRA